MEIAKADKVIAESKTTKELDHAVNTLNPESEEVKKKQDKKTGKLVNCIIDGDCKNYGSCNSNNLCECTKGYLGDQCELKQKNIKKLSKATGDLVNKMDEILSKDKNQKLDENTMKTVTKASAKKETCNINCVKSVINIIEKNDIKIPNEETKQMYKTNTISNAAKAINYRNNYKSAAEKAEAIKQGERIVAVNKKINKETLSKMKEGESITTKTDSITSKLDFFDIDKKMDMLKSKSISFAKKNVFSKVAKSSNKGNSKVKVVSTFFSPDSNPFITKESKKKTKITSNIASFNFFNDKDDDLSISSSSGTIATVTFSSTYTSSSYSSSSYSSSYSSSSKKTTKSKCMFFNKGSWSSNGITSIFNKLTTSCETGHFSTFALVSLDDFDDNEVYFLSVENPGFILFITLFSIFFLTTSYFVILIALNSRKQISQFKKTKISKIDNQIEDKGIVSHEIIEDEIQTNENQSSDRKALTKDGGEHESQYNAYPIVSLFITTNVALKIQKFFLISIWFTFSIFVYSSAFAFNEFKVIFYYFFDLYFLIKFSS